MFEYFQKNKESSSIVFKCSVPPPPFSQKPVQPKLEPKAKKAAKVRDPGPDPD